MIVRFARSFMRPRLGLNAVLVLSVAVAFVMMVVVQSLVIYQSEEVLSAVRFLAPADIVVTRLEVSPELVDQIRSLEGVQYVEPGLVLPAAFRGEPLYISAQVFPTRIFRVDENLIDGQIPSDSRSILITKSFATRHKLTVGDTVRLAAGSPSGTWSTALELAVSGILRDDALTPRIPVMNLTLLAKETALVPDRLMILLSEGADIKAVTEGVRALAPGSSVRAYETVFHEAQRQAEDATSALRGFTGVLFATMGLLVWCLSSVQGSARFRDIGVLLVLGARAAHVQMAIVLEALSLCVIGCLLGGAFLPVAMKGIAESGTPVHLSPAAFARALLLVLVPTAMGTLWALLPFARHHAPPPNPFPLCLAGEASAGRGEVGGEREIDQKGW